MFQSVAQIEGENDEPVEEAEERAEQLEQKSSVVLQADPFCNQRADVIGPQDDSASLLPEACALGAIVVVCQVVLHCRANDAVHLLVVSETLPRSTAR
jgi:hypothetical protein